jgi:hypothetical protein
MEQALRELSPEDRAWIREVFTREETPETKIAGASVEALDAFVSALAYEKEREGKNDGRASLLRMALVERSRRGKRGEVVPPADGPPAHEEERPDRSHRSSRVSLSGGTRRGASFWRTGLYAFRHDLLDRTPSFNFFSEVRLLGFEAEKAEGRRLRLEAADLIGMASLAPYSVFDPQKSWKVEGGWSRIGDARDGLNAGAWRAAGAYGLGRNTFGPRNLAYLLAAGEIEKSSVFDRGFRLSPGVDLGWVLNPVPDRYFAHFRGIALWDATSSLDGRRLRLRAALEQSYFLTPDWDVRLEVGMTSRSADNPTLLPKVAATTAYRF